MTNILKRLEIVEKEVGGNCVIPEKERIIVIPYPNGQEEEFERLKQESIKGLREKYGLNFSENDLLVIGIRKFYRRDPVKDEESDRRNQVA